MKVYWRGRDGSNAPQDAVFSCCPFFSNIALLHSTQRIENLPRPTSFRIIRRKFFPEKQEWIAMVERAIQAIDENEIEKVVLARRCDLECEHAPDPFAIAAALESRAENATLFCFADEEMAFLGATPEMLFSRQGELLFSEAMAGTKKRGHTPEDDKRLERDLLESEKDLREFTPVQSFLQNALSPFCIEPLSFSPLRVRKTQNVQHLYSQLSGRLRDSVSDDKILSLIHPTPALCGMPPRPAADWIRKLEPFERGLYGGVVGWSTKEMSEWAVAIRCCLIRGKTVHLYTGTGIVAGSDPSTEWEELNLKMKLYDGIFV